MTDYAYIIGRWGTRSLGPEILADYLARFFASLSVIPLFRDWRRTGFRSHSSVPAFVTLPPDASELRSWVRENPTFGAEEGRKRTIGYSLSAETSRGEPLHADLLLFVRDGREPGWFFNRASITLFAKSGHEADLAPLVRPALLALASSFDCEWAAAEAAHYAMPDGRKAGTDIVRYESGGRVYLAAPLAAQITPPADIGIEHLADGALLMTAAAVFDRKNAQHLAAAHRIQLALAPLNAAWRKSLEN
jgi:hypothetical protein